MARGEGLDTMNTLKTDEILQLMEGMAANKIATLEFGGLKLHATVNMPFTGNSASGISVPTKAAFPITAQGAIDAVAAIKAAVPPAPPAPAKTSTDRLLEMQARTAAVRGRAASGIGSGVDKAVRQIFKAAKAMPPSASKPTTT